MVGHVMEIRADRLAWVRRIADEVERTKRITTLGADAVLVNHPDVLQELLVEKARHFDKAQMVRFALYPLAGEGLFTSRGDLWRKQRKIMAPMFHVSQMRGYAADMAACTDRWIRDWKDGDRVELSRETTRITMSVAGKTLFDAETFTDADAIGEALTVALAWTDENAPSWNAIAHVAARRAGLYFGERWRQPWLVEGSRRYEYPRHFPGEGGRRLKAAIALLDAQVAKMIADRRRNPQAAPDLLSRLLHARDEDDGTGMTDKQVRDEVLTLFVAGHETTATGLAWALHCLCNHPEIYARVEAEVDALGREPTFDDLPRLGLTLRVFREALRLYPPVYVFSRQACQATSLDGYDIEKNTVVILSPWALHRRPDLFPEPERFDPDRFLPEVEQARPKLSWLPFGAGPRVCIGNQFAMMEGQIVLAKLLRHARFEPIGVDTPDPGATLRPRGHMPMRVHLRPRLAAEARVGREAAPCSGVPSGL